MTTYKGIDLFGIPVYEGKFNIHQPDVEYIKSLDFERMEIDNGYSTVNKHILELPELSKFKDNVLDHCGQYLYQMLTVKKHTKFRLLNSWATKHEPNDWAQKHDHVNSFVSGIVYLDVNNDSGNLHFHKNNIWQNIFPRSVSIDFETYNPATSSEWVYTPQVGDIFLFPSSLEHSVTVNQSKDPRYVCAFNLYPEGKFTAGNHSDLTI